MILSKKNPTETLVTQIAETMNKERIHSQKKMSSKFAMNIGSVSCRPTPYDVSLNDATTTRTVNVYQS